MEENKVAKALYDHLISRVELGDYAKFENDLATNDAFRKAMFDEGSTDVDWGDYATFESNVKKKGSPLLDVGQGTGLVSQEPSKEPLTPQQPLPSETEEDRKFKDVTKDLVRTFTSTSKRMAGGMAGLPMLLNRTLATYTIRPIIKAMGATDEEAQQTVESIIRSNTMGQLASVTEEAQKVMNKSAQRDEQKMAQIEGSIWENLTKGKDGEKNVGAGFEQLGRMVVGFLPYSALTAATAGAGTMPVIATMGATAAAQKYSEMEGTAEPKRILNSWMYGGFEGVGEAASAVIFRGIGKAFRQGLAKQLPKKVALSFAKGAAESVGLEASSEVVTQIGQNFTDIVTGVDPQRGLFDGVLDVALGSAAFGLITGGGGRIAASVLGRTLASDKETEQVQTNLTQQGTLADQIESTDSDPVKKALESRLKTLRYEADKVMDKNFELAKELTPEQRMKVAELYSTWNELQAKIDNGEVTNEVGVKTIEDTVNGIKEEIQSIKEATLEKLGEIKKEGAKFKIGDTTFETEEAVEAWLDKNYQKRGLPPIWHTPTEKVIDAWYKRNKEEIDKRELQPLFKTEEETKDATEGGEGDQTVSEEGRAEGGIGTVESIPLRDVSTDKSKAQGETGEVTPVQETEGQFMTIDEYEEKYLSDYKEGLAKKTPQERRELEKVLREKARTHWKEFQDVTYRRTLSDKQDVYFIDAVKSGRITPQRAKAIYDSGGWNLPEEISKLLTPVQKPQEFTPLEQKYIEPNKQKEIVESFTHYKSGDKFYPRTIWADWFLGKDRKAKERIANEIEENPQLKNALLSFWYDEYIKQTGEKISFEEFLNKDIEIYRGESQQDIKTPDIYGFQTYAPTEQEARIWAEKTPSYTGKVIKTIVKPKNTYGLIQSVGAERELLVPTKYSQEFLSKIWDKFSGANEGVFNNLTEEQGDKLSTLLDANNYQGAIDELKKIIENKGIKAVSIPSPKEPQGEVSVTTTEAVTGEGGITAPPEQILPVVPPPVTPPVKGEEKRSGFEKRETPQGTKGSIELRTDEIGQIVRDIVDKNPHFYKELHREDALRQAQDLILSFKDLNDAYSNLLKKTTDLSSLPVRHVARQILIQKFGEDLRDVNKLGDKVSADAIADKIINLEDITQREVRISGQTSAMTMWKVLNPEATVFMVNKLFNDVNKRRLGFEAQQAEDFIEKWNTEVPKSVQRLLTENPDLRDFIDKIQAKVGKEVKNARTTKAKAKDIANKVRSLKSTNWGFTFADPIGAVAILDGALEVTAKTIEATGNILQAINDGIAEIKKSKWYNGLTSVKQKEVESKYREKIRANIDFDAAEYIEGQSWYKSAEKAEPTKEEKEKKVGIKEKSQASKRLKEQIYDVIASHWLVEKEGGESLVDRLVRDIGLTKSEAERIAKISEEAVRRDSEKVFERTLGDKIPNKKTRGNAFDKFFNLIKKGALTNENYYEVFAQKHKLKTGLTEEEKIKLKKLAITAEQMSPYGYFGDMAHDEFLQYMAKITEADSWLVRHSKLMLAANYARMLSGLTTHKVNLSSSAMNLLLRPISHGADMTQWMNVVLNMAKGNWKEAHVKNPLASLFYAGGAFATGARIGKTEALNIIKHGNIRQASKYMESVDNISGQNIPELDKNTFGVGKRFRPIMVGVGKWKVDLNPWNYMKYSGRTLLAEDSFMVNLPFALELSLALREKAIRAGEVGGGLSENKKLADKIFAQIAGENLTEEQSKQIESQLEEQVRMLQTQGIEPSASQIKQRRFELTRTFLDIDKEMVDELTQLARDNIFTSYRGGVFSQVGDAMGRFFNKHLAIKIITMPKIPFTGVLGRVADMGIDATPIYGAVRAEGWSPTGILARIRQWERTGDWRDFFVSPQKAGLFRSAQLGERGSKAYNQQMARQWLGLWSTLLLGAIFLPDDDKKDEDGNPWIDITGSLPFSDYEKKEQHYLGAYTAKVGDFKFRYLNYPVINMPFAIIGNYRDHIKAGVDPEDAGARMALLAHSWFHSLSMIKDTWLAKGINDMVELIGGVINTFGQKEGRERVRESDKIAIQEIDKRVTRQLENLRDDYTGLVIKYVDPLKSNLVQQLIKFGTPEGRLKGTGKQLWLYNSGLQWWNDKRTDIFGQEVKVMPGDQGIAWPRDNDQRWKKMWDYNIDLTDISPKDKITVKGVPQTLEWEDYIKRKKLTGELFTERFDNYFKDLSEEEIQKRLTTFTVDPRSAIKTNQIHEDVLKIWNNTKSDVSKSMFVWDKQVKANPMVFDRLMRAEALPDFHKPSIEIKGEKIIIPFDKLLKLNDDIMVRFVVRATPYLNSLSKEEFEKARTTISKAPKAKEGETKLQFKIRGYWESSVERPDKELELEMKREFGNTK